jgi:hypothetical protein
VQGNVVQGRIHWWETNWAVPRLLGGIQAGPDRATLAGGALHVFMAGSIGGAFGLVCGGVLRRPRLVLLGMLAGLIWQELADALLWGRINPLIPLYSRQPATLFSHALFGACLGYWGGHPGRKFPPARHEAQGQLDGVE